MSQHSWVPILTAKCLYTRKDEVSARVLDQNNEILRFRGTAWPCNTGYVHRRPRALRVVQSLPRVHGSLPSPSLPSPWKSSIEVFTGSLPWKSSLEVFRVTRSLPSSWKSSESLEVFPGSLPWKSFELLEVFRVPGSLPSPSLPSPWKSSESMEVFRHAWRLVRTISRWLQRSENTPPPSTSSGFVDCLSAVVTASCADRRALRQPRSGIKQPIVHVLPRPHWDTQRLQLCQITTANY